MKKFLTLSLLFASLFLCAQEKTTVAFIPINYDTESVSSNEAKIIQEAITNSFVATKRFTVVDRQKIEEIEKEKKLQRSEAFIESKTTFKDGVSKGAGFLVGCDILNISTQYTANSTEIVYHIQLKIIDVSTGEILVTENVNSNLKQNNVDLKLFKDVLSKNEIAEIESKRKHQKETAKNADPSMLALEKLNINVKSFINRNFPTVIEIAEWNKKKETFTLAAGYNNGISELEILDVIKQTKITVAGKEMDKNEKIGSVCVFKIHDGSFSEAIIIDGEKEVLKSIKKNEKLALITK